MIRIRRWAPVAASGTVVVLILFASVWTATPAVILPPLPGPVHVATRTIPDLQAETAAPLLAPSRSNLPVGAADAPPPAPPPALAGIVAGGGKAVALVKPATGETAMAHVGDTIDGWALRSIETRRVIFERNGEKQIVELIFAAPSSKAGAAAASAAGGSAAPPPAKTMP